MKNLLLELYAKIVANDTLKSKYSQFVELVELFEKYKGLPPLNTHEQVFQFLAFYCRFSPTEYSFIREAETGQEVYDFLSKKVEAETEHLVGGYEPSEGLVQ